MKWKLESAMVSGCSLWPLKARGQICLHWGVKWTWGVHPGTQGMMNQHPSLGRCRVGRGKAWGTCEVLYHDRGHRRVRKLRRQNRRIREDSSGATRTAGQEDGEYYWEIWISGRSQRANQMFVENSCSCLRHVSVRRWWVADPEQQRGEPPLLFVLQQFGFMQFLCAQHNEQS